MIWLIDVDVIVLMMNVVDVVLFDWLFVVGVGIWIGWLKIVFLLVVNWIVILLLYVMLNVLFVVWYSLVLELYLLKINDGNCGDFLERKICVLVVSESVFLSVLLLFKLSGVRLFVW